MTKKKQDFMVINGEKIKFKDMLNLDKKEAGGYDLDTTTRGKLSCKLTKSESSKIWGKIGSQNRLNQDVKEDTLSDEESKGPSEDVSIIPKQESNIISRNQSAPQNAPPQAPDERFSAPTQDQLDAVDAVGHHDLLTLLTEPADGRDIVLFWIRKDQIAEYSQEGKMAYPAMKEDCKYFEQALKQDSDRPGAPLLEDKAIVHPNGDICLWGQHRLMFEKFKKTENLQNAIRSDAKAHMNSHMFKDATRYVPH